MKSGDKILRGEWLYRRVYRNDRKFIDPVTGRPSSRAFTPRPKDEKELSVDLSRLTTPETSIVDSSRFILFQLESDVPIDNGLDCIYDPLPATDTHPENLAHTLIRYIDPEDETIPGLLARSAIRVGQ